MEFTISEVFKDVKFQNGSVAGEVANELIIL